MITEDYVSFETAKLLKEKGMDASCFNHYVQKNNNDGTSEAVTVCTLQMAMKWLRETYDIDISIISLHSHKEYLPRIESDTISHDAIPCRKYEDTCETAIKYCLEKLI
jgi:hypothetical protein